MYIASCLMYQYLRSIITMHNRNNIGKYFNNIFILIISLEKDVQSEKVFCLPKESLRISYIEEHVPNEVS